MNNRSANKKVLASALAALTFAASNAALAARDHISIVGSSTVYPFTTVVAERFSRSTQFKTPVVESTGTGGGMKLFCQGVGESTADLTGASRRIKQSELEMCNDNGVDVVEVQIGYDGIVLANAKTAKPFALTRKDIFLALAKDVPNPDGSESLVANPYKTWKDVNPTLPAHKIEVLGPPPTSGTRDAFVELAMEGGCKKYDWIAAKKSSDKNAYKSICHNIREDGAYVEAGENDNLIVNKLAANPNALGIFGFSFLDQNADKVQGSLIEGQEPTFESIADNSYPVSRPLFVYLKKAHVDVVPGIKQFMAEFTSERAWGEEGYLADKGMIPLPTPQRQQVATNVRKLNALTNLAAK
ncbi:PstS family phosphate ABC transporter substrate-binding protein [Microbulbifer salipaludis]|uniref:PstS family phosphate ABC transporter substrate-binding protein n=1 Tax=Microbulbifer salipaludis TaxID=187980 RepID=A0ABS3E2U0_9GAMM|nr:PstS family phosphate ABC transporter substrate-binding protein [Microbulbifer salipaludis]MBN8429623.1 PstS family phosphate ABC transporter substrate-binding protein [Microbulbifer salipaludis]